ncbi:methyl-accepting chemotaxis protein [Cupriavidus basilensis]|uniref:Methyl-accepting chemotaxis protein n=1 Tax=Cupriavidus basilensis TaxID=68895 RepID=A0ABT6AKY3_9BURK|nr:methyl-accepting chemotaxis protein [Cupriavidus basilensis]MDF3833109.1 methyl-accepting chemotaxis protein [Cupriavidus basilensis]
MKNLSVRTGLLAILVTFALMIVFGAGVGVLALRAANQTTERVQQIAARTLLLDDAYKDMTRARSALARAYSSAREGSAGVDANALDAAQASLKRSGEQLQRFGAAAALEGQDEALRRQVVGAARAHAATVERAMAALRAGDPAGYAAVNDKEVTPSGAAYSKGAAAFQQQASQLAQQEAEASGARYGLVVKLVVVGITAALGLIVAVHLGLRAFIVRPLAAAAEHLGRVAEGDLSQRAAAAGGNEVGRVLTAVARMQEALIRTVTQVRASSDSVNIGAREIAAGNTDLSSRTEQQSASLEQTAASMEQLTSTVSNNTESARQASTLAAEAARLAMRGGDDVRGVVQTMGDINGSSQRIADIIGVIDGIAFQTNILALNAAVEAARAGEAGRGFAVVAGEVRALAQRSANAAREIKSLIDDSASKVSAGNALVAQAGQTMSETVEAVRRVARIMEDISSASLEQSAGIVQVSQAVTQMEQVTQQNAALVEQAAAAAGSLEAQAHQLAEAVGAFRLAPVA